MGEQFKTDDSWIVERTGIHTRPIVGDDVATSDLAISAGINALKDAGISPEQVGIIRLATVTPDEWASPPTVSRVVFGLGVPLWDIAGIQLHEYIGTDQSYAYSSYPVALMDAVAYLMAGFCEYALVIGADKMSSITNQYDRGFLPILADHAAALVLKRVPFEQSDFKRSWMYAGGDGSKAERIITPVGGSRSPVTTETIIEDPLLASIKLNMAGNIVFRELVGKLKKHIIPEALEKAGLTPTCIDMAFFHQANLRMIDPVEEFLRGLGFRDEAVVYNSIQKYGNTTCATLPLGIHDARTEGLLKSGHTVMLVTMGGGYSWLVIFIRWGL